MVYKYIRIGTGAGRGALAGFGAGIGAGTSWKTCILAFEEHEEKK